MLKKVFVFLLISILTLSLISCDKEELPLFPGTYTVNELTYHYFVNSYVPELELVSISQTDEEYYIEEISIEKNKSKLVEFELTKNNFDEYFEEDKENFSWQNHENLTKTLRKENNRAWYGDIEDNITWYFLLQNDGSKYIVYISNTKDGKRIDNIYHLEALF